MYTHYHLITGFCFITLIFSGCVIDTTQDDTAFENESTFEEDLSNEEYSMDEEIIEESTEIEEDTTTTTITTVVETPGSRMSEGLTCSVEDQGFGEADRVEVYVVTPPETCVWSETAEDLDMGTELAFLKISTDQDYLNLFTCNDTVLISDIDWDNEIVIYLSGWILAGSEPTFEWAVEGPEGETVLGLVTQEICREDKEFYQSAFIAPKHMSEPRVIGCSMPSMCE